MKPTPTHLSCYAAGDLDPASTEAVKAALAADPEATALVAQLRDLRVEALRVISEDPVPPVLLADLGNRRALARPRTGWRLPMAIAATLAVLVPVVGTLTWWALSSSQGQVVVAEASPLAPLVEAWRQAAEDPSSRVPADQPEALAAAFAASDAPEATRVVPDLTAIGWTVEGVVVLPGHPDGIAVIYRDGERLYVCQMWKGVPHLGVPVSTVQVNGHELRVYEKDGISFVIWDAPGMVCVLSSDVPMDALVAAAVKRVSLAG